MPLVLTLHRARAPADRQRESRTLDEGSLTIGKDRAGFEGISASWPLAPGRYVARLLIDDSYISIGQSPEFTITR